MILEGIVTTTNIDGTVNISPMGPSVDSEIELFELRPFQTSRTYQNLKRTRCGVLHVVDDVMLIAQGAVNRWQQKPELVPALEIDGHRIDKACQAYEFQVTFFDDSSERTMIKCKTVKAHLGRRFFGFNRAKHAVLEAAILATRVDFLPMEEIQTKFSELRTIVDKTGCTQEHAAFELLDSYVCEFAK
jgi:hypothetical protein